MEVASSFLTEEKIVRRVTTNVARTYLINDPSPQPSVRSDSDTSARKVAALRGQVSEPCLAAASAIERVLDQLGESANRIVRSSSGELAFLFFAGPRYAMLECDDGGAVVALVSDRSSASEAETWIVDADGLTSAVRRIRSFLGAPHDAYP